MRVLLTGAGGFVGHHVLEHFLINTDWDIVVTDSFRHHGVTDRISEVLTPLVSHRVTVLTHDLTVPWSSVLIEKLGRIDAIFNVASESHVDRSILEPVPFVRNNVDLILSMLELARVIKPLLFVQLSTDEVYGAAPLGRDCLEWDPILPSNPYSASKAAQEAIAISYWRTYDVPLVLLNCMNIIGERQHPEKFVPKTIARVLQGATMQIHASADGRVGSRFYLHARNLADAMLFVARQVPVQLHGDGHEFPHRFNVVGETEVDNLTMAQRIAEYAGRPLHYELVDFHSTRPGHDLRYALDGRKLRDLGWTAPVALWDSLRHTVRWSLEHPAWLRLADPLAAGAGVPR